MKRVVAFLFIASVAAACGSSSHEESLANVKNQARSKTLGTNEESSRCDSKSAGREMSEYDTSGDTIPDVRKVFLRAGTAPFTRLVLICREADLNGDGSKDVVRYYNDEGRPIREESDRNFDSKMDEITIYENGRIVRMENDTNGNGIVDLKTFFEAGRPVRSERDTAGKSTVAEWKPDHWEYFEKGRMVRMGSDVDGDGRVDRWDRDDDLRKQLNPDGEQPASETGSDEAAQAPAAES